MAKGRNRHPQTIRSMSIRTEVIKLVEIEAKKENRTISNYVETVLLQKFGIPE